MFRTKVAEKMKTHILCSIPYLENRSVCDIMWKNIVELGRPQMIVRAHFMLDTYGYTYTLRICNTYYFSAATMVTRTRLTVTLYVHCMSC
jgi:hypothetical protein